MLGNHSRQTTTCRTSDSILDAWPNSARHSSLKNPSHSHCKPWYRASNRVGDHTWRDPWDLVCDCSQDARGGDQNRRAEVSHPHASTRATRVSSWSRRGQRSKDCDRANKTRHYFRLISSQEISCHGAPWLLRAASSSRQMNGVPHTWWQGRRAHHANHVYLDDE